MKISTRGRYALRLMIDIAQQNTEEPIPLKEIAKRQEISVKYLEQIVSALSHAKLIHSLRGSHGGYRLAKEPKDYTVKEILETLEGPTTCVSCLEDDVNTCPYKNKCSTLCFYQGLNKVIIDYMESYTLQDFLDQKI
jgi:Rrf2 family protein